MINQLLFPKLFLGKTKYSFARYGCLSSVIIEAFNYAFKKNKTPDQIVPILHYDSNGYLQWDSIRQLGFKKVVDIRKTATPYAAIKKAYASPHQYVALEVNNGAHFVWLYGRWWPYLGYRIYDPYGGIVTYSQKRNYKITGCRVIELI